MQAIIYALQTAKVVVPAMDASLRPLAAQLLPPICSCCCHAAWAVRFAAASCAATLAAAQPDATLPVLLRRDLVCCRNGWNAPLALTEAPTHLRPWEP